MEFLVWHYGQGLNQYLQRWLYAIAWIIHFFSLPILLKTLFSPWKRLIDTDDSPGLNFQKIFRQLSFNLVSRGIGAVVRLVLFLFGILLLLPATIIGLVGCICWIVIPIIGLPYYLFRDPHQRRLLNHLEEEIIERPQLAVQTILSSRPGIFLSTHLALTTADLLDAAEGRQPDINKLKFGSFNELIHSCIDTSLWNKSKLRQNNTELEDLAKAAEWWDKKYRTEEPDNPPSHFSKPGIGLELLFGYTPTLNSVATDLSLTQPFSHHLIGREALVSRIERSLSSGSNVALFGLPGVGKRTVVLELARRALAGELGPKMIYKRIMELDYNALLAQAVDTNQKKTILSQILAESAYSGNVILVVKDLHRLTNKDVEGLDFTDIFEQYLEKHELMLITISSQADYERFSASNTRLRKYFDPIEITSPSLEEAGDILMGFASSVENQKGIIVTLQSQRTIINGCDKYITDTPFPEKSLEILDQALGFVEKNGKSIILPDDVNAVISETTGISLARMSEGERNKLTDLENILHKRLVGQDVAVSLIAKSLRARSVGAKSEDRPLGSFLFLGPTGVGKTEAAKTLANVYFGSSDYLVRFDMAEYAEEEGLSRLIGSVSANQPGRLTSAIKNRPASLLLLDEIEKAPPEVRNLFLSLLDEGVITDAFGKKIICKHLFIIATSNAGAEFIRECVGQKISQDLLQKKVIDYVQKQGIFSPEFLNRFDGVVVFEPLTQIQLVKIAQFMLNDLKKQLEEKDITLEIAPQACEKLASDGYEPEFGARPMRRVADITIGDILGKALLKQEIRSGDRIKLTLAPGGDYALEKL